MFKTARPLVSINGIKWVMSPIWIGSSSWSSPEIKTIFCRFFIDYLTKTLILQFTFKLHKRSFSSFTSLYNLLSKLLHKKTCTWSKTSFVQLTQNCKIKVFRQKKFEFFNRMVRVNKSLWTSKYAFKSIVFWNEWWWSILKFIERRATVVEAKRMHFSSHKRHLMDLWPREWPGLFPFHL